MSDEHDHHAPDPAAFDPASAPPYLPPAPAYVPPAPAYAPPAPVHPHVPPHTAPQRRRGPGAAIGFVLLGVVLGGAIFSGGFLVAQRGQSPSGGVSTTLRRSVVATDALETAAAKVLPSVVNIAVQSANSSGVGSGVIIRSDGYILTNNHVVAGATRVTVTLGAQDVSGTVVGADPISDIAVVRVAKSGLPVATLGNSASLKVGETVLAIGSPFGLDRTVTSGIVSALHRSDQTSGSNGISSYTNLIQTDAAINPGNSGGALADLNGAVVGMNTLIQSPAGSFGAAQSAGIGFAIPIDFAKTIADMMIAGKPVTHPYFGVSSATITPVIARFYGLAVQSGAYVQDVTSGSPADKAGLLVDDIVVSFGGRDITSTEDLFAAVQASSIGTTVPVIVSRNGSNQTFSVVLVAR